MKLHVSFIADAFRDKYPQIKLVLGPSSDWNLKVGYPHVLQLGAEGMSFGLGDLVLSDAGLLGECADGFEGCSLICIGAAPQVFQEGRCDYLELPEGTDPYEVLECLIAMFGRLESWRERVVASMVGQQKLDGLYSLYLELLENPLFFTNESHEMIVYVEYPDRVQTPDIYGFGNRDEPNSNVQENLMRDVLVSPLYDATFKTSGPQFWTDDVSPFDSLYCNVSVDGIYQGRILVDEQTRRFRISDYALLQMLHDDMISLITSHAHLAGSFKEDVWQHLVDVLAGATPDPDKLELLKREAGWEAAERFICLAVHLDERDKTIRSGSVNRKIVERALPGSRAVLHENAIVVIAPVEAGQNVRNLLSQELAIVIRDNLMKAGASNVFSRLDEVKMYYDQAELALETGRLLGRMDWVLYCDDCLLPFMLHHCTGALNHRVLCHSRLQRLLEYDSKHDLEYTQTLKGYMENSCSQVETCNALYIHRSTLVQRLKRIAEITRLDLDNKDVRLYLRMYFAAMDQRGIALM